MARKAIVVKQDKLDVLRLKYQHLWKKMPKSTKYYNRCKVCWRVWSYIREYWICRVCLRKFAREGLIMWLKKSSW